MLITRGYRTELDLNNKQVTLCKKHAGCARFAYNWGLARKQAVYRTTGHSISAMELHRELNALKPTDFPWMYECSKAAPQEALRDLDKAYQNFFRRCQLKKEGKWKGPLGFPVYKTKRQGLGSFRLTGSIHVYEKAIDLPRLGRLRLKECGYLPTGGVKLLSATVSEEAGRWFVSVQVEEEIPDPPAATGEPIGIDTGINRLAQCSDGRVVENPKALRSELKRLTRLHRRLSRKAKGSKNRAKARMQLAHTYARVAHVRQDALHKSTSLFTRARLTPEERAARRAQLTASLPEPKTKVKARKGKRAGLLEPPPLPENIAKQVKEKQVKRLLRLAHVSDALLRPTRVALEVLNVDGMKRNHKLARSISDVGLGEFRQQMTYKTAWQGETLRFADRWFPSTKICSRCGRIKEEMDLSERIYVCENPACGLVINRDFNAALNLAVLVKHASQPRPYREFLGKGETPVERGALADPSQDGSVKLPSAKQEPDTSYGLCP
jgi:transposase